jgi:hypothetical protein
MVAASPTKGRRALFHRHFPHRGLVSLSIWRLKFCSWVHVLHAIGQFLKLFDLELRAASQKLLRQALQFTRGLRAFVCLMVI